MKSQPQLNNGVSRQKTRVSGPGSRPLKKKKHLGGKALSLEAFANAKSKSTEYNPAQIKKQREFYRNAKYVSKYKKSLKDQSGSQGHFPGTTSISEDVNGTRDGEIENKKKYSLQSLREEYEKRREEEEKAKMEREVVARARKEERDKAEAQRKAMREKMLKKTRSGQPVMKYRLEHLLEGIQRSTN